MDAASATPALPPRVMFDNAPAVLEALASRVHTPANPELDLAACMEFDSSVIGLLLELMRRVEAAGSRLRLLNPSANLRKLATLYGVQEILF
jgi:ABC-type transporter Mla MlaB component